MKIENHDEIKMDAPLKPYIPHGWRIVVLGAGLLETTLYFPAGRATEFERPNTLGRLSLKTRRQKAANTGTLQAAQVIEPPPRSRLTRNVLGR